jgi:crossover junction endodeoxyribonuclease RuvC
MPKSRTKSWRAFDPVAFAAGQVASSVQGQTGVGAPAKSRTRAPSAEPVRLVASVKVRILGLDPGSRKTGFGVIECGGAKSTQLAHGCIAAGAGALNGRLRLIFEGVQQLIAQYQPDEIAVERVFLNRNVDSALKLGHARGAALCAVPEAVPVFEYAPRAIKLAVVGFGAAEKEQVAHMMRALLGVEGRIQADASDALAIALCHAHSRRALMLGHSLGRAR